jgi:hypothetical protein
MRRDCRNDGTSVGTVKKTLFRVVDRLRQHFAMPAVKG